MAFDSPRAYAIAQLIKRVTAPRPDLTVIGERNRMRAACGHRERTAQKGDLHGQ